MHELIVEKGRIRVDIKIIRVGDDLCLIISGGDRPHIGAVTLSVPRPSLANDGVNSASTSVLTLTGHKDDDLARLISTMLASKLNKHVVVICGIHLDEITPEEIDMVENMVMETIEEIVKLY
jgi:hypothetical protein